MITINKVRMIEVKRTRIKGNEEKGIAPFHAITLTVSHSPSHHANPYLEKIQVSLMSEVELPALEALEAIKPVFAKVVYAIKDDSGHLFIPNGTGDWDGTTLSGGVHTKDGKRLRGCRIAYSKLIPIGSEMAEQVLRGYEKLEEEFNENEEAGMRTLTEPEAWEGGFADNA